MHTILTISRYTLGCAIDEQQRPNDVTEVEHHEDPETSFEFGLQVIISGLRPLAS